MKGTTHFHSLGTEDNLSLKNAQKINKIVSEVRMMEQIGFFFSGNNRLFANKFIL